MKLVDIEPVLKQLKEELKSLKDTTEVLTCEESVEIEIDELKKLPIIDPEKIIPLWRDPNKNPPKVETEVLVLVDCGKGYCITTAFYEDGTVPQYESIWQWEDVDDYVVYDEAEDLYRIQKSWWEYRHFTPEDALECPINKPVVGWMPLPPKGEEK